MQPQEETMHSDEEILFIVQFKGKGTGKMEVQRATSHHLDEVPARGRSTMIGRHKPCGIGMFLTTYDDGTSTLSCPRCCLRIEFVPSSTMTLRQMMVHREDIIEPVVQLAVSLER